MRDEIRDEFRAEDSPIKVSSKREKRQSFLKPGKDYRQKYGRFRD